MVHHINDRNDIEATIRPFILRGALFEMDLLGHRKRRCNLLRDGNRRAIRIKANGRSDSFETREHRNEHTGAAAHVQNARSARNKIDERVKRADVGPKALLILNRAGYAGVDFTGHFRRIGNRQPMAGRLKGIDLCHVRSPTNEGCIRLYAAKIVTDASIAIKGYGKWYRPAMTVTA